MDSRNSFNVEIYYERNQNISFLLATPKVNTTTPSTPNSVWLAAVNYKESFSIKSELEYIGTPGNVLRNPYSSN